MAFEWIEEELRRLPAREAERKRSLERRAHCAAVVRDEGPRLMRRLVDDVRTAVDEYTRKVGPAGSDVTFQPLPHEGFSVTKTRYPCTALECRPDYVEQVVGCNFSRTDDHDSDSREWAFTVQFIVNEADTVELRHETETFHTVERAVEFLLRPVLFPPLDETGGSAHAHA